MSPLSFYMRLPDQDRHHLSSPPRSLSIRLIYLIDAITPRTNLHHPSSPITASHSSQITLCHPLYSCSRTSHFACAFITLNNTLYLQLQHSSLTSPQNSFSTYEPSPLKPLRPSIPNNHSSFPFLYIIVGINLNHIAVISDY
jgi:hypothetical protein